MKPTFHSLLPIRRLVAGLIISVSASCGAFADVVSDWNATLESALRNPTPSVPAQARACAIVHAAIFDAVNGITRKYAPLRVVETAPPGARPEAAAAYAAYTTLVSLFPGKQAMFDTQLNASLAEIPGAMSTSTSIALGRAWGENVAQQILAWRANDGFTQPMTYPGSTNVGSWRHAPLGAAPAGGLTMSVTAPFALADPAAFVPGPPYGQDDRAAALTTLAYAADLNEVKERGGLVSAVRTPEQAALAMLIHISDVLDINAIVRRLLPAKSGLDDSARIFALLNIAACDAGIVCFKTKYKYGLWRPFQAIVYADLDGNSATTADPAWQPYGSTPSHPEYISGHSTISGAMLAMAAALLGNDCVFTLTTSNPGAPAVMAAFTSFSAFSHAIVESRIDMGFHFRTACELGRETGYAVAGQIVRTTMLRAQ